MAANRQSIQLALSKYPLLYRICYITNMSSGDCLRSFCSPQDSPDLVAESATVNRVEVLGLRDRDFAIFISILPGLLLFD